jgi:hypothetical protein
MKKWQIQSIKSILLLPKSCADKQSELFFFSSKSIRHDIAAFQKKTQGQQQHYTLLVLIKIEAMSTKKEVFDQTYLRADSKTQNVEEMGLNLIFHNNFW